MFLDPLQQLESDTASDRPAQRFILFLLALGEGAQESSVRMPRGSSSKRIPNDTLIVTLAAPSLILTPPH